MIQKTNGYSKITARKDSTLDFRIDFSEFRFAIQDGIYTCYAVAIAKPEGVAPLAENKGDKWEPTYPLKVWFNLTGDTDPEKAAIKAIEALDPSKCYSGFLSVQNTPFAGNIASGKKADGSDLPPEMLAMLLEGLGSFKECTASEIKDSDVVAVKKQSYGGGKQYKSRAENAQESLAAIEKMLKIDTKGDVLEIAAAIDAMPTKESILAIIAAIF